METPYIPLDRGTKENALESRNPGRSVPDLAAGARALRGWKIYVFFKQKNGKNK